MDGSLDEKSSYGSSSDSEGTGSGNSDLEFEEVCKDWMSDSDGPSSSATATTPPNTPNIPQDTLRAAIMKVAKSLGYDKLKEEQTEGILQFANGRDVFISLPTGYGKSLCYIILPSLFDELRRVNMKSMILVVSLLIALMRDQVASIAAMNITATLITDKEAVSSTRKQALHDGEYQIIYISPEALISIQWRNMLSTKLYRDNLVAFVVDEAHCIRKWGASFRKEFSHLGEIRSIIPPTVHVMALTATATLSTRNYIIRNLSMHNQAIVYKPPVKNNVTYFVADKPKAGYSEAFQPIVEKIIKERANMDRVIIFCRTYENVIGIHRYFRNALGQYYTEPIGSPDYVKYRMVDMYTHCTHPSIKSKILNQFTSPSPLRLIIATVAFGMGINCPDVRQVIHWGVPEDCEMYVQESGRAGRDGKLACALLLKNSHDLDKRLTSKQMILYCKNKLSVCRRSLLYSDFLNCKFSSVGCMCCDVCATSCKCGQCSEKLGSFFIM